LSFSIPLGWIFGGYVAYPEGDALGDVELRPAIGANSVSPEFFDTLKIPLVDGRGFTSQDTLKSTRVAVVNETLASGRIRIRSASALRSSGSTALPGRSSAW
jgi:hypothetical protein